MLLIDRCAFFTTDQNFRAMIEYYLRSIHKTQSAPIAVTASRRSVRCNPDDQAVINTGLISVLLDVNVSKANKFSTWLRGGASANIKYLFSVH
jgi:hypothetical protein